MGWESALVSTLGLNPYAHDAGVALVCDGQARFCLEEERLNREKKTRGFPRLAIRSLQEQTGISGREIDSVWIPWKPVRAMVSGALEVLKQFPPAWRLLRQRANPHMNFAVAMQMLRPRGDLSRALGTRVEMPIRYIDHHLAHASNAWFSSPFERAAILIVDGFGDRCSTSSYLADESRIRMLHRNGFLDSLGILYAVVTMHLGFRSVFDEGTVMAMAAHGSEALVEPFRGVVSLLPEGGYRIEPRFFEYFRYGEEKAVSQEFISRFGAPRRRDEPFEERHFDLAHALQRTVEEVLLHLSIHLRERTGAKNLCVGGGVAMNCLAMARLAAESGFERVYVSSAPSDAGLALGAAQWGAFLQRGEAMAAVRGGEGGLSPFLGPAYSDEEIRRALERARLPYRRLVDPARFAARHLAQGAVVGWVQGAAEYGPRSLGARSLLADPRSEQVRDRLLRIKRRLPFRPFAPSVLSERAHEWFESFPRSPYMSFTACARAERRPEIPAVLSADGSARVQTVGEDSLPLFRSLIEQFDRETGVPMVLNTSFNVDQPTVCTPEAAIDAFVSSEIDILVAGSFATGALQA
jgi:carbamoyltransferase